MYDFKVFMLLKVSFSLKRWNEIKKSCLFVRNPFQILIRTILFVKMSRRIYLSISCPICRPLIAHRYDETNSSQAMCFVLTSIKTEILISFSASLLLSSLSLIVPFRKIEKLLNTMNTWRYKDKTTCYITITYTQAGRFMYLNYLISERRGQNFYWCRSDCGCFLLPLLPSVDMQY